MVAYQPSRPKCFIDRVNKTTKVRTAWTTEYGGHDQSLDLLRKVVAMGIRCFEHHGVPERMLPKNE